MPLRPDGEIGRHTGLKILRLYRACRFDSGSGHHLTFILSKGPQYSLKDILISIIFNLLSNIEINCATNCATGKEIINSYLVYELHRFVLTFSRIFH